MIWFDNFILDHFYYSKKEANIIKNYDFDQQCEILSKCLFFLFCIPMSFIFQLYRFLILNV